MGLKEILQEELDCKHVLFECKHPGRFIQTECGSPRLYALWRLVWMVYHIAAIITSGSLEQFYASTPENRIKWFIFLTNWSFIILTLYTIIDFCCTVFVQWTHPEWVEGQEVETLPWYLKALWLFSNIGNSMAITVSLAYWGSGTFDPSKGLSGHRVLPFIGHGMNSIYVFLNLCVTGMPVRLLHWWQPFLFTIIYGTFNVVYIIIGATDDLDHPYIYPPLNWRTNPLKAEVLAIGMVTGVVLVHISVFFFHLLRRKIASSLCRVNNNNNDPGQCPTKEEKDTLDYGSTHRLQRS